MSKIKVETPSDREVRVTREFAAPLRLVWDAHTKPELIRRWLLGPAGWSMPVCESDFRVGGKYHNRWRNDADGREFGFNGVHHEIEPMARIVTTEYMDGVEGPGARNTLSLAESDGRTIITLNMDFGSKAARDAALATGMTDGMELSYQRIDALAVA